MFEVLIALMMSFLFLAGTLNAMVISTVFQVKAERQAQASYWIQEDLEEVRSVAANYTVTTGCPSSMGTTFNNADNDGDNTDSITGYTDASTDNDTDPNNDGLRSIPSTSTRTIVGRSYTLTRIPGFNNNVSTLTYTVQATTPLSGEGPVATLYTEVLPQAALSCP